MSKKTKILSLVLSGVLALGLFSGCKGGKDDKNAQKAVDLTGVNGDGVTLNMSVLYTDLTTRMKYDGGKLTPYEPKAYENKRFSEFDWKPTWSKLQEKKNFTINDVTMKNAESVSNSFTLWAGSKFNGVDILNGTASGFVDYGIRENAFVDLSLYRDQLPDFFKFVDASEITKKSITSENGAIYYAPYFDGYNDIETMFLCRVDYVQKLLDDDNAQYDTSTTLANNLDKTYYNGFYDSMNTEFQVANKEGTAAQTVKIQYNSGEGIIAKQNALAKKDGVNLVKELKAYIDKYYVTPGYITKRSELFCGQNACYNADELIALWRCVYTNPGLLTGNVTSKMVPFYPRSHTTDRTNQILQLAQLWGVRGYESRNGYFYLDENGELQDSRVSADMMEALEFLHQIYQEGLILQSYQENSAKKDHRDLYNENNRGFMTYDYNQTTSVYNESLDDSQKGVRNISPILFPVADWDNKATAVAGKSGQYSVTTNNLYQYTESWRSVKTEGWGITIGTTKNPAKLKKALELFNYMYTDEGQRLMTFGPDEFISFNGDVMETIDYDARDNDGKPTVRKVPKIKPVVLDELNDKYLGGGNYTNYYRYYVGATLPIGFVKEQGMEYQTVDEKGKVGLNYINKAANLGTLKHATVVKNTENIQNSLIPTTFALTSSQTNTINSKTANLGLNFNNSSAEGQNIFHSYVINGFDSQATLSKDALVKQINEEWNLKGYLTIHRSAYKKMYKA